MKFSIQSSELNAVLQSAGKIINPKHPIPIMEYFIFVLEDGKLEVTASDQETTQITTMTVEKMDEAGSIAVPSRLILDVLKEFVDQLITISANPSTHEITVDWGSGTIAIPGQPVAGYPDVKTKNEETLHHIVMDAANLYELISLTIFATADKDSRPTMMGILFDITPESTTVVATDAHKLVRVALTGTNDVEGPTSFILPKKPANNLKALLQKEDGPVTIEFDNKNIHFSLNDSVFICRAIEGHYPNYNSVIPQNNHNTLIIDRVALLSAIKRVSICSDKSSNLVRMNIVDNTLKLQAKDVNFYVSADDSLVCNHSGDPIDIGFKYMHLIEMLTVFSSQNIQIELSDSTRAGLFVPIDSDSECEKNSVVLLMPIM
ncbi:MAG: DNA polymerase III subunit beta [Rikenellaceae bacterium]